MEILSLILLIIGVIIGGLLLIVSFFISYGHFSSSHYSTSSSGEPDGNIYAAIFFLVVGLLFPILVYFAYLGYRANNPIMIILLVSIEISIPIIILYLMFGKSMKGNK